MLKPTDLYVGSFNVLKENASSVLGIARHGDFQGKNYHMPATPGSPRWPSPGLEISQPRTQRVSWMLTSVRQGGSKFHELES